MLIFFILVVKSSKEIGVFFYQNSYLLINSDERVLFIHNVYF